MTFSAPKIALVFNVEMCGDLLFLVRKCDWRSVCTLANTRRSTEYSSSSRFRHAVHRRAAEYDLWLEQYCQHALLYVTANGKSKIKDVLNKECSYFSRAVLIVLISTVSNILTAIFTSGSVAICLTSRRQPTIRYSSCITALSISSGRHGGNGDRY